MKRHRHLSHGPDRLPDDALRTIVHGVGEYIICGVWEQNKGIAEAGEVLPIVEFLKRSGLSYHRIVMPDGTQIQTRRDHEGAWHAYGYNYESRGVALAVPGNHDLESLIEAMERPAWPTDEQLESAAAVVREWYKLGAMVVEGHDQVSPERKQDPGPGFPWPKFRELVEGWS